MQNIGEEICGEYLRYIKKCDFISYNVTHPDMQGEMDVIGIDLEAKTIYVCEAATHTGGLQYVTDKRPDDYNRFKSKFDKSISYAKKYFPQYSNIVPMIWSPIVRMATARAKYDTYGELKRIQSDLKAEYEVELELVVNEKYQRAIADLKEVAFKETSAFSSSVMRLFQIESKLNRHVANLENRKHRQDC